MKGSIRVVLGLILVMASAGGIDNASDAQLIPLMIVAALGLASMASGARVMR